MKIIIVAVALVAVAAAAPQWRDADLKGAYVKKVTTFTSSRADQPMLQPMLEEQKLAMHMRKHAMPLTKEGAAEIVEQDFDMPEPGHYQYRFKTNNGIEKMEQAAMENGQVRGAYVWTSPEGVDYKVEYVADELGFHPMGAHLPVAPEVPEAIKRSLEWNAAHPEEDKEAEMMYRQVPVVAPWAAPKAKASLF